MGGASYMHTQDGIDHFRLISDWKELLTYLNLVGNIHFCSIPEWEQHLDCITLDSCFGWE
jgi:hypothetical protein